MTRLFDISTQITREQDRQLKALPGNSRAGHIRDAIDEYFQLRSTEPSLSLGAATCLNAVIENSAHQQMAVAIAQLGQVRKWQASMIKAVKDLLADNSAVTREVVTALIYGDSDG